MRLCPSIRFSSQVRRHVKGNLIVARRAYRKTRHACIALAILSLLSTGPISAKAQFSFDRDSFDLEHSGDGGGQAHRKTYSAETSPNTFASKPTAPRLTIQDDVRPEIEIAKFEQFLKASAKKSFSGVVLLASEKKVLIHQAFCPQRGKITTDSQFWVGSVSKNFCAAAIVKLQHQKKLSVNNSIDKFFKDVPKDKKTITIHQLLTHSSGIRQNYAADGVVDRQKAIAAILKRPLASQPGTKYLYSNDGYNLLAAIVEIVSKQPFEDFVAEQLLQPAGMKQSGFWGEATNPSKPKIASTTKERISFDGKANWGFRGATGMRCSANDLFLWSQALSQYKVMPKDCVEQLFKPHIKISETRAYGYGWQCSKSRRGTNVRGHTGVDDGVGHFAAIYRFEDEGLTLIFLSNSSEKVAIETLRGIFSSAFSKK